MTHVMLKVRLWPVTLLLLAVCCLPVISQERSAIGYWKTIDDGTDEVKSIVHLWEEAGELKGRIVKLFPKPGEDPNPLCDKCKKERKDQPVIGMIFLWGFKSDGERWVKGKILDPENGKIYNCRLNPTEDGAQLKVFGYVKIVVKIGRSQTWIRATEKDLEN